MLDAYGQCQEVASLGASSGCSTWRGLGTVLFLAVSLSLHQLTPHVTVLLAAEATSLQTIDTSLLLEHDVPQAGQLLGDHSRRSARHIYSHLEFLSAGWSLEVDSFNSATPKGLITFSNLLAVLDPSAPRRLLLACHYDSKAMPPASKTPDGPLRRFLGASDAAVPCAMILELVTALDVHLKVLKQQKSQVTLQLVFFDGNEAFQQPSPSDSLYGSRYLADQMSRTPHPPGAEHTTLLNALDLFVLLDLIGAPDPMFVNHFDNTVRWFDELIYAERRLHKLGLLSSHPREVSYFRKDINLGPVEDDHVPFLQQGVPVLHMITTPFPSFMHTLEDTAEHIHSQTIENLTKVLVVFLAEYIGL